MMLDVCKISDSVDTLNLISGVAVAALNSADAAEEKQMAHQPTKPPQYPPTLGCVATPAPEVVNPKQGGAYGSKTKAAQTYPQGDTDEANGSSGGGRSGVNHNLREVKNTRPTGRVGETLAQFFSRTKAVHPQDAIARAACEAAKVEYKGILDCGIENGALILFDCPWHKTTMAVKLLGATPEIIVAHLAECSFGHVREAGAA